KLLARRLARHGMGVTAGTLAVALAAVGRAGVVPPPLGSATAAAARLFAVQPAAAGGLVSAETLSLALGVLKTMMLTRMKSLMAVALAFLFLGAGSGVALHSALAAQVADPNRAAPQVDKRVDPFTPPQRGAINNPALERRLAQMEDQLTRL